MFEEAFLIQENRKSPAQKKEDKKNESGRSKNHICS